MAKGKIDYDTVVAATSGDALLCRGGARLLQRLHGRTLHRVLHRRGWLLGLRHRPLDEVVHAGEAVACDAEV